MNDPTDTHRPGGPEGTAGRTGPLLGPALARLGQIALPVRDLERAIVFYRDVLMIPFLFRAPGLAFFDCAGVRLMLSAPQEGTPEGGGAILYFAVPDIHRDYPGLKARGVEFIDTPRLVARMPEAQLWMAFFRDGEGNMLAIMTEFPTEPLQAPRPVL